MSIETLMGDEAVALGALHAGLSCAYAYPGTPSTEIMEFLQDWKESRGGIVAEWCANEKTAYESALGASFAGRRAMVSMKHVGLNVAADPFVNSALVRIHGGLVVAVTDDPGMHSSQDEQDSRALAEFARVPCFEPSDQQEAYDMTRAAFDYSERHEVPVMVRLTTRLAHSRAAVKVSVARNQNPTGKTADSDSWILMPATARRRWRELLGKQARFETDSEAASSCSLAGRKLGVITAGIALQYYREAVPDLALALGEEPSHLHLGHYPLPPNRIRELAAHVGRIIVLEEGYPLIEDRMRGLFGAPVPIAGKRSGELPPDGELTPDLVREALGLPSGKGFPASALVPPPRPPQFCQGCPHADSYEALNEALRGSASSAVLSDIGCYTLGALAPYRAIESCVDMGASVGMARGASAAGLKPVVAVIGDSTFYHSGLPNLIDAVYHGTSMTLVILDNGTTGMTGAQSTIVPSSRLEGILRGIGVESKHIKVLRAHRNDHAANVAALEAELAYEGVSVVVMVRECLESLKKARKS